MPNSPGSASGLRLVAWTSEPARAERGAGEGVPRRPAGPARRGRTSRAGPARPCSQLRMSPVRSQVCPARTDDEAGDRRPRRRPSAPRRTAGAARTRRPSPPAAPAWARCRGVAGEDDEHDGAGERGGDTGRHLDRSAHQAGPDQHIGTSTTMSAPTTPAVGSSTVAQQPRHPRRDQPGDHRRAARPTKPIGPATVTAAAVRRTASSVPITRVDGPGRPARRRCRRPARAGRAGGRAAGRPRWPRPRPAPPARKASNPSWLSEPLPHAYRPRRLLVEEDQQRRRGRLEGERQGRARQDQPGGGGAGASGQPDHRQGGDQAAGEGHRSRRPQRHRQPEGGDSRDGEVGAARHRQRVGGCQGVAGQRLEQSASHTEGDAHDEAGEQPREPREPTRIR